MRAWTKLQERLAALSEQAESLSCRTSRSSELERQKQRIETYQVQARFELAAIYDKTREPEAEGATMRRARAHAADALPRLRLRSGSASLASTLAVRRTPEEPATIKDLEGQQVDVSPDPPQGVDTTKTMDSYKRFLDLNAGDAALRAEALRRLGDLNLESSESERIERELATNEGLRATEAIHLYSALLKAYPNYERNDAVLYQLARAYELNAQPDKALAALDRLVATYPNSRYIDEAQFRRGEMLFSDKAYPARAGGLRGGDQHRARSPPFYNQSLYKHGWSLFKQGETRAEPATPSPACSIRCWFPRAIRHADRDRHA